MAAGEQRDEQLLDHFALADDALGDFVGDAAVGFAEALDGLEIFGSGMVVRIQGLGFRIVVQTVRLAASGAGSVWLGLFVSAVGVAGGPKALEFVVAGDDQAAVGGGEVGAAVADGAEADRRAGACAGVGVERRRSRCAWARRFRCRR